MDSLGTAVWDRACLPFIMKLFFKKFKYDMMKNGTSNVHFKDKKQQKKGAGKKVNRFAILSWTGEDYDNIKLVSLGPIQKPLIFNSQDGAKNYAVKFCPNHMIVKIT